MTPDHYTYPTVLPQHSGDWFFKEQIERLEIAISERPKPYDYVPKVKLPFEQTSPGKVLAFLQSHPDFVSYRELGELMEISRKSASNAVNNLRHQGYGFEEKIKGQLVMVRLK